MIEIPYIRPENRKKFLAVQLPFKLSAELNKLCAGDLNYLITWIIDRQIDDANYARYNEMIGMLECCKQELYRRMVAPYEDKKKKDNGDAYSNAE